MIHVTKTWNGKMDKIIGEKRSKNSNLESSRECGVMVIVEQDVIGEGGSR